jgi:hypothetical protein
MPYCALGKIMSLVAWSVRQLISQLDAELGIEKFRTELESSRVLVRVGTAGAWLCSLQHAYMHEASLF